MNTLAHRPRSRDALPAARVRSTCSCISSICCAWRARVWPFLACGGCVCFFPGQPLLCPLQAVRLAPPAAAMHIQEIVIDGFKSYATRTVVSCFDASFNAITGARRNCARERKRTRAQTAARAAGRLLTHPATSPAAAPHAQA